MSKQLNRPLTKNERKKEKREEQRRKEAARLLAAKRRRTLSIGLLVGAVALALILSVYFFVVAPKSSANGQTGSGTNTNTAPTDSLAPVVDNIGCSSNEGEVLHYHVHVSIYINGKAVAIPAQIGIPQTSDPNNACFYWMHTHDTSGVIHIESPVPHDFTLGNFFHIWSQQFAQQQYPLQLDTSSGWTVYLNGKPYTGDFYNMKMSPHMLITMAYQSPGVQPDTTYNWNGL